MRESLENLCDQISSNIDNLMHSDSNTNNDMIKYIYTIEINKYRFIDNRFKDKLFGPNKHLFFTNSKPQGDFKKFEKQIKNSLTVQKYNDISIFYMATKGQIPIRDICKKINKDFSNILHFIDEYYKNFSIYALNCYDFMFSNKNNNNIIKKQHILYNSIRDNTLIFFSGFYATMYVFYDNVIKKIFENDEEDTKLNSIIPEKNDLKDENIENNIYKSYLSEKSASPKMSKAKKNFPSAKHKERSKSLTSKKSIKSTSKKSLKSTSKKSIKSRELARVGRLLKKVTPNHPHYKKLQQIKKKIIKNMLTIT